MTKAHHIYHSLIRLCGRHCIHIHILAQSRVQTPKTWARRVNSSRGPRCKPRTSSLPRGTVCSGEKGHPCKGRSEDNLLSSRSPQQVMARGRGGRCRTLVTGFGDRCSTVELRPHRFVESMKTILSLYGEYAFCTTYSAFSSQVDL